MFRRLQEKWGVSGLQFVLIFCVFAIGGSLTGFLAKKLMPVFGLENEVFYWVIYVIVVTLMWPVCVMLVSIPFGQFRFFLEYQKKLFARITRGKRH